MATNTSEIVRPTLVSHRLTAGLTAIGLVAAVSASATETGIPILAKVSTIAWLALSVRLTLRVTNRLLRARGLIPGFAARFAASRW